MDNVLVTGAAGFIGSAFVRQLKDAGQKVVVLDVLSYAGHLANIEELVDEKFIFQQGNIEDGELVLRLLKEHDIQGIVHFAAESHVDNSISGPLPFIKTNVNGTFTLLEAARDYWTNVRSKDPEFRFLHVSTDEVFGELGDTGKFSETTPYAPNSPYSASKAASDHLVRAWFHTYGLPTVTTNCSNNYGPRQFPEKLIPRMIQCAIQGEPLPVYGDGSNIRDWIHVEDHCRGIGLALKNGRPGDTYCFGGNSERTNLTVVKKICEILAEIHPKSEGSYEDQITFVEDRLGHDFRYAIDDSKAQKELNYSREFTNFEEGLKHTIQWYLENKKWVESVQAKKK